ncbi:MAG: MBL fold metallo-hydrolase [Burkholderiaceae bacterium]|jgi:glyoxylase-like metal-dependent hydrolase (beta-lactamase superfamily II)|nr:MBL fold metallo-hydrolase [Burkholderiaceae bacterium]
MNALEKNLHYVCGDTLPGAGLSIEVRPGIRWVRMPLPFVLDHINLWLLRDEIDGRAGWTVVDCSIAHPESRALWEQVFATQLDGLPILRVVVTHMHPDHVGLAHWLCERWNAPLWMSTTDYYVARVLLAEGDSAAGGEAAAAFFALHGMTDRKALDLLRARTHYYRNLVSGLPDSFVRMIDGDVLRIGGHAWRCLVGHGHAPEHIALYSEDLQTLIGGDMMLPRISSNVSVYASEPEANPLRMFLDSLAQMRRLPVDTLTLPAHGKPFKGMHRRIEQLEEHHRARLLELQQACTRKALSAYEAMPVIFTRKLDLHQTTFALGETLAHLHLLHFEGLLRRTRDAEGIVRFGAAVSPAQAPAGADCA